MDDKNIIEKDLGLDADDIQSFLLSQFPEDTFNEKTDITVDKAAELFKLTERGARSRLDKLVKTGKLTTRIVKRPDWQAPKRVWSRIDTEGH